MHKILFEVLSRTNEGFACYFRIYLQNKARGFQSGIGLPRVLAHFSLQLITPFFDAQLHVVPYRGNKIVLDPKIGRRTRSISRERKERLSIKVETLHFSFK